MIQNVFLKKKCVGKKRCFSGSNFPLYCIQAVKNITACALKLGLVVALMGVMSITILVCAKPAFANGTENKVLLAPLPIPFNGALRGNFTHFHNYAGNTKQLLSKGQFVLAPAVGVEWNILSPLPTRFIGTSGGVSQVMGQLQLLKITADKQPLLGAVTNLISAAYAGNWGEVEKYFLVSRFNSGLITWIYVFTPKAGVAMPFKMLEAKGDKFLKKVVVVRKDGGTDILQFSDQTISGTGLTALEQADFSNFGL